MKLKKFNEFKQEDLNPLEDELNYRDETENDYDTVEDFKKELDEDELTEDDYDLVDNDEEDDELAMMADEDDEFADDDFSDEGEEEEAHEYKGTVLMNELARKLGTKVVDNQINFDGKVINYYSETEKFHIGKEKFETVEEVLDFLGGPSNRVEPEEMVESKRVRRGFRRF